MSPRSRTDAPRRRPVTRPKAWGPRPPPHPSSPDRWLFIRGSSFFRGHRQGGFARLAQSGIPSRAGVSSACLLTDENYTQLRIDDQWSASASLALMRSSLDIIQACLYACRYCTYANRSKLKVHNQQWLWCGVVSIITQRRPRMYISASTCTSTANSRHRCRRRPSSY